MKFEFATATRIVFGVGAATGIGQEAAALGRRAFVLTGARSERALPLLRRLENHHVMQTEFRVEEERAGADLVGWRYTGPYDQLDGVATAFAGEPEAKDADAGVNYYWRVLTRTADGWIVGATGRFEAPICPADDDEEDGK